MPGSTLSAVGGGGAVAPPPFTYIGRDALSGEAMEARGGGGEVWLSEMSVAALAIARRGVRR